MSQRRGEGEIASAAPAEAGWGEATEWSLAPGPDVAARVSELFEALRLPVYRYLCATFGGPARAEDVTQETFLRLYQAACGGQHVANVRAWVFRVAHNLVLNQIRHDRFLERLDGDAWADLLGRRQDPKPGPEVDLIERERLARVRAGLVRLSPQQRQCLVLRVEGLRYREIADVLGVDISTVAESLRRGVRKLTRQIDDTRA